MFMLLVSVWMVLLLVLVASAVDVALPDSFVKKVLSETELAVFRVLWWLGLALFFAPFVWFLIDDARQGGTKWVPPVVWMATLILGCLLWPKPETAR